MTVFQYIEIISKQFDCVTEWAGKLVAWLVLGMVVVTFSVVVMRYGFDYGRIAIQEAITYMHGFVFMLAMAYTLKMNEHVRVDVFFRKFTKKTQSITNILGTLLLLIPTSIFIFWISWDYVYDSWFHLEGSKEAGGLPFIFILKSTIPIAAFLLLLQGVSEIFKNICMFRNND